MLFFSSYQQAIEPARQSILYKKPSFLLLGRDKVENKKIPLWLQTIADTNYVKSETKGIYDFYCIKKTALRHQATGHIAKSRRRMPSASQCIAYQSEPNLQPGTAFV
jgi:hypothetical protein